MKEKEKTGKDVIKAIAKATEDVTQPQVRAVIEALRNHIRDNITTPLISVGVFQWSERSARQGQNPATGELVTIPAMMSLRFRSSQKLRNSRPEMTKVTTKKGSSKKKIKK